MGLFTDIIDAAAARAARVRPSEGVPADEKMFRVAEGLGWRAIRPNQRIELNRREHSIAISGVTWSRPDLEILDNLASRPNSKGIVIWLFDPSTWNPGEQRLPGLPFMKATPMFAEYTGETVVTFVQGPTKVRALIDVMFPR